MFCSVIVLVFESSKIQIYILQFLSIGYYAQQPITLIISLRFVAMMEISQKKRMAYYPMLKLRLSTRLNFIEIALAKFGGFL